MHGEKWFEKTLGLLALMMVMVGLNPCFGKDKSGAVALSLEEYIRQARESQPPLQTSDGSLYSDAGLNSYLFSDLKARRVNDILTIRVFESTVASNSADTQTSRKTATSLGAPNAFGIETNSGKVAFDKLLTATSDMQFAGDGATTRRGTLSAFLSARVREVLPNGDLVIEGIKEVKVNNERQILRLLGVVRTRDIAPSNVVPSTAVANMQVQLDGKGIVTDHLQPGWLYRVLTKVWPF
ncbi:MAG: flagellar basal body L-ring protein FlgH [Acidobacteriota bacterium]